MFRPTRRPSSGSISYRRQYIPWNWAVRCWDLIIYLYGNIAIQIDDEISTSNSLNPWDILSPTACWTWWWPPSRTKHVVQLTIFADKTCRVFDFLTLYLYVTHTAGCLNSRLKYECSFGNGGAFDRKVLSLSCFSPQTIGNKQISVNQICTVLPESL
jgi:hypothetical protein